MCEGYPAGDEFGDDGFVPLRGSGRLPIIFNGHPFSLGPDNAAIRSFNDQHEEYSRVIVYLEDDSTAPFKPENEIMQQLVHLGVPVELPEKLDETDHEFMADFMQIWTEDANRALGI